MNKIFFIALMMFNLLSPVTLADVGIVVDYNNGGVPETDCIRTQDSLTASKLIEQSSFTPTFSANGPFGRLLCKVNGIGENPAGNSCEFNGKFWAFYYDKGDGWAMAEVGLDSYKAPQKSMIGLIFGSGTENLPEITFDEVCPQLLSIKKVVAITKEGKESITDGEMLKTTGETIDIEITVENKAESMKFFDVTVEAAVTELGKEDEDSIVTLPASESEKMGVSLELDEEGEYHIILEVKGGDEKGKTYRTALSFIIDKRKEDHKVIIDDIKVHPVDCSNQSIEVLLKNEGRRDEKGIITAKSLTNSQSVSFSIDEDEDQKVLIPFQVEEPSTIILTTYDSKNKTNDEKSIFLQPECEMYIAGKTVNMSSQKVGSAVQTQSYENTPKVMVKYPEEKEFELWKSPIIIGLVLTGYIFAIAGGIALILKTRKKRM